MKRKYVFKNCCYILFFFICINNISFGQIHHYKAIKIDSFTFLNTRKIINSLSTENFIKQVFKTDTAVMPYRLLLPKNDTTQQYYPLVITLHNSARIGNDNESQLEPLAKIWLRKQIYDKFRCFVLAPQFSVRSSVYTKNDSDILVSQPAGEVFTLLKLIDEVLRQYPDIDKKRIYLVGYSMGGSTVQNLINLTPGKFAAMVSIAGVPDFSNTNQLSNSNIWLIHGQKDDENPYIGSEVLFRKLNKNKHLLFSTYTNLTHNNIMIPYLLCDDIPKWLFSKMIKYRP